MNVVQLQARLRATGRYDGNLDGQYGSMTRAAVLKALTDGPDTRLTSIDLAESATRLGVSVAKIVAFKTVEAAGVGFEAGRPKILFEGHRFSRATKGRFDRSNPAISYPKWDRSKYPGSQDGRYKQLLDAVGLDVDAGFASASYGAFQILGENFGMCGFSSPFGFAEAQAQDEEAQLMAFENFIRSKGILPALKAAGASPDSWIQVVAPYNGPAFRENNYHVKAANAYVAAGGR